MNKPLILVVEDDAPIRNLITTTLKTQDYKYIAAATASEALQQATIHAPDVMLLDLGLPDLDGIEVIRRIRSWSAMPIIVISARSEDSDKIEALDSGADDYLTKPFSVEELLARLRVTFRRISMLQNAAGCSVFTNGDLQIDFAAGCATLKGQELHLTPIEYRLLCVMAKNCGKVLTHTYITHEVWGSSWDNDVASLRVFMATLRKKLGLAAIVYSYFRILSRNTRKRYSENLKYLSYQNRVTTWFGKQQVRFKQRKDYHYYRCPQCGQQLRVPRGRGKISITCPKCGHQFIKKS